jgi:hypothetical protein
LPYVKRGKKRLDVLIDENVFQRMREISVRKTRTSKGLSAEVEKACRAWITEDAAHTHGTRANIGLSKLQDLEFDSPVAKAHRKILAFLSRHDGIIFDWTSYEEYHCPRKLVVEAIKKTRGLDKRVIRDWLKNLEEERLIIPDAKNWATSMWIRKPGYIPTEQDKRSLTPEEQKILDSYGDNSKK